MEQARREDFSPPMRPLRAYANIEQAYPNAEDCGSSDSGGAIYGQLRYRTSDPGGTKQIRDQQNTMMAAITAFQSLNTLRLAQLAKMTSLPRRT
jgi:hypothetical protein